ncbi:hypothetical protein OH77DRAFT_970131 [Trametes cingulata]|nr:hypothetical protein OH77DRAFT_970131 [Trametes cingulata]
MPRYPGLPGARLAENDAVTCGGRVIITVTVGAWYVTRRICTTNATSGTHHCDSSFYQDDTTSAATYLHDSHPLKSSNYRAHATRRETFQVCGLNGTVHFQLSLDDCGQNLKEQSPCRITKAHYPVRTECKTDELAKFCDSPPASVYNRQVMEPLILASSRRSIGTPRSSTYFKPPPMRPQCRLA